MIDLALLEARAELQARTNDGATLRYLSSVAVDLAALPFAFGAVGVATVADCGAGRFDFTDNEEEGFAAFLLEAFDADGETVADLVAWPLDRPAHVLTLFGRAALVGLCEVLNPTTYFCGLPLDVYRTPLDWLRAGCQGAAVVTPALAAPLLLDAPLVAGRDDLHTAQLAALARSAVPAFDPIRFLSASAPRRAA